MEKIEKLLSRGVAEVIQVESLTEKLKSGRKLKIKLGVDPTSPDLHLGHVVVLKKLKEFQELGHEIIFLIGDYTTKIGDPSEKNKTRPMLSDEEIAKNTETYIEQVGKIFDTSEVTIKKNSEWLGKLDLAEVLKLASKMTVASILERDDFSKRYKGGTDIGLHELFYPLMQAYDSVELKADVELGGTDQKFNLLAGRELMKKLGLPEQDVMTMPLLIGTDGKMKMSKSLGNYIALNDSPSEMFGKVMSLPDEQIIPYYELVTNITTEGLEVVKCELKEGKNPRDIKAKLAFLIVELVYDAEQAEASRAEFDRVYKNKEMPSEISEVVVVEDELKGVDLIAAAFNQSKSEAKRLIDQGAVVIENRKIEDPFETIQVKEGIVIKGGRKFIKIKK
jgi:tyrosyl-tRNA synthetase